MIRSSTNSPVTQASDRTQARLGTSSQGSRRVRITSAWITCIALYVALVPTGLVTSAWSVVVTQVAALVACIGCLRAALVLQGRDRLAWIILSIAAGAWAFGRFAWDFYPWLRGAPRLTDIGYLTFGPLLIIALAVLRTTQNERRLTWLRLSNLGLILCGIAMVLIVMLMQPFRHEHFSLFNEIVIMTESTMIAIAFIVALYVLWSYRWGDRFEAMALITISIAIHMLSALFYTRELVSGEYSAQSALHIGWLAGFGLLHWAGESQVAASKYGETGRARQLLEHQGWVEALVPAVLVLCIAVTALALRAEITPRVTLFGSIALALFALVLAVREGYIYVSGQRIRAELIEASAELREARDLLSEMDAHRLELQRDIELMARAGAVGLWDWDLRTDRVRYSREWKSQLGFEEHEIGDSIEEWRSRVHPDDLPPLLQAIRAFLAAPRGEFNPEHRLRHRDGSYRWILVQASVQVGDDGKPLRMLGSHVDITDRKLIELSLRESQERYRELVSSLETHVALRTRELTAAYRESQSFAYAVAHDLKAPLRAIDGFSHLLESSASAKLDASELTYIKRIRNGALNMASLIDGLLAYSRLEHYELRLSAVDIHALVHSLVTSFNGEFAAANAQVEVSVPQTFLRADVEGLSVVLRNLLDNALKFANPARALRIEIGGAIEGDAFVLHVRDNGIGFDPAYREKIFEIFNRLHASGYSGTGIGLALVRKAVERMQGEVWAQAEPDRGATFFIKLPLHAPVAPLAH